MIRSYTDLVKSIPAYVINLDFRNDRWDQAKKEFEKIEWFVTKWKAVHYIESPSSLSAGHAGCLESHRQIWRNVIQNGSKIAAIFEDDAVFPGNFRSIFPVVLSEVPDDWDVLHLHSFRAETEPVTEKIVRFLRWGWGSHGYLITAKACEALLTFSNEIPTDAQLMYELNRVGKMVYGVAQPYTLCFQRGEDSDIPNTAQTAYWKEQLDLHWKP
jgi:GR25 family glycosyltransferase involved in LPS biosynthesis